MAASADPTIWDDFNPHEREARDAVLQCIFRLVNILIHTSVKLVTNIFGSLSVRSHFNPHEREARDADIDLTAHL